MVLKHYVEFLYAGVMFTDTDTIEIDSRNSKFDIPKNCFGYRFYDIEEIKHEGEKLRGKRKNQTGVHYFGTVFNLNQIKKLMPDSILYKNMKNNGYNKVVKTRSGNYQPLEKGDVIERPILTEVSNK